MNLRVQALMKWHMYVLFFGQGRNPPPPQTVLHGQNIKPKWILVDQICKMAGKIAQWPAAISSSRLCISLSFRTQLPSSLCMVWSSVTWLGVVLGKGQSHSAGEGHAGQPMATRKLVFYMFVDLLYISCLLRSEMESLTSCVYPHYEDVWHFYFLPWCRLWVVVVVIVVIVVIVVVFVVRSGVWAAGEVAWPRYEYQGQYTQEWRRKRVPSAEHEQGGVWVHVCWDKGVVGTYVVG